MLSSFASRFYFGASSPVGGGGINPIDVTGLVLWLDASDVSTIILDGMTSNILTWSDKSESGFTATTGVGTVVYNPANGGGAEFNNSTMFTGTNIGFQNGCIPNTGAGGRTLIAVVSNIDSSTPIPWPGNDTRFICQYGSEDTYKTYGIACRVGNGVGDGQAVYGANYFQSPVFATTESSTHIPPKVISCQYNGTVDLWREKNQVIGSNTVALDTGGNFPNIFSLTIGARMARLDAFQSATMTLHELIAYNNAISESDWNGVGDYLISKWGVL